MSGELITLVALAGFVLLVVAKTAIIVPQQRAFIVERLGKYRATLSAGFYILVPFIDTIRYRHSLKEMAVDIAEQICITRDNVQVGVDGVLYMKVLNAETCLLRHQRLRLRHLAARPDDATERGWQDRSRQDL